MIAANNGDMEMVKVLMAKGADPSMRGPGGANALSLAKDAGKADVLKLLESQGAKP
jgi:ankyrin repeat protein